MATRRRIPMVGDHPPEPAVVVPLEYPNLEVTLQPRREVSSSEEAREFDWEAYAGLMISALIVPKTIDSLVEYWNANVNMLDWAKKVRPETFERIRTAFSVRRKEIEGGRHG